MDADDLKEIADAVVNELEQRQTEKCKTADRLGFTESEAASLLGIPASSLRDARYRGEIVAAKIGKRNIYDADELRRFIKANRR